MNKSTRRNSKRTNKQQTRHHPNNSNCTKGKHKNIRKTKKLKRKTKSIPTPQQDGHGWKFSIATRRGNNSTRLHRVEK